MKNPPSYAIASVDHALTLAAFLQLEGPMRLADAAERLGVARSTAHRILAMLVYRDFAVQLADRSYGAGPVLSRVSMPERIADLRRTAMPHLQKLTEQQEETSIIAILVGDRARFVATVECGQLLRVGNWEGRSLPAHLSAVGKALLALRSEADIREMYEGRSDVRIDAVIRSLNKVRRDGYALNERGTEEGVAAIACPLPPSENSTPASIALAMPTIRFDRAKLADWHFSIRATAAGVAGEIDWPGNGST